MPVTKRNIVACGGFALGSAIQDFILGLARGPRVLFVGTATGDDPVYILSAYERLEGLAQVSHLKFFPYPPPEFRELALSHDVIFIGGGNTANMLAIWRLHGFDEILREAWEQGIVLAGSSAGMICWFEAGVTDSFGPQLEGMRDGLRFLPGSACPHYDGEDLRRPRYRELVDAGFPPGYAAEDAVALHFAGEELAEAVTAQPGKLAYRVEPGSETPIKARVL
jgi:dipeptidase E